MAEAGSNLEIVVTSSLKDKDSGKSTGNRWPHCVSSAVTVVCRKDSASELLEARLLPSRTQAGFLPSES